MHYNLKFLIFLHIGLVILKTYEYEHQIIDYFKSVKSIHIYLIIHNLFSYLKGFCLHKTS